MRKVNTRDVFEAMRLIQKSGLKEKLTPVIKEIAEKGTAVVDTGIMGILSVIEVFSENRCEQMICEWLAGPFEMDAESVEEMDLEQLADALEALGRENNIRRFFSVLSGLLTRKA